MTGLEIVTDKPQEVLRRISKWHRLKELSFFNDLVRSGHNHPDFDQSELTDADLPSIDKLTGLESLGLCGREVTGDQIKKMHLLGTIKTLKLETITGIESLLKDLETRDNIKELWLVQQDLFDNQLAPLLKMKGLASLTIRVSNLTPKSLNYFKQMTALKHLSLDCAWSPAEKRQFQKDLPLCQFEGRVNYDYWKITPADRTF